MGTQGKAYVVAMIVTLMGLSVASSGRTDDHFRLELKENTIRLEAKQAPLIEVIRAIAQHANLILVTQDDLEEPITITLDTQSVEDAVERLLAKRNYAVFYSQNEDGTLNPSEIRVFGSKSPVTYFPGGSASTRGSGGAMPYYSKKWYAKEFQHTEKLARHFSAKPIPRKSIKSDPLATGIVVEEVVKNSVFSQIGIRKGDLIRDVNGQPVNTTEEFLAALQAAADQAMLVRIERLDANLRIDPIYIELR